MATATVPQYRRKMTFEEFRNLPETNQIQELHFGLVVRDAPDTRWHQVTVGAIHVRLYAHVSERNLGAAFVAPTWVVLDKENALVLEPDVLVVLNERLHLVDRWVDGPPNLVIEVASKTTRRRDRKDKLQWYRTYGVQECWLVDGDSCAIEVFNLEAQPHETSTIFKGDEPFASRVLPDFRPQTGDLFDRRLRELLKHTRYDQGRS